MITCIIMLIVDLFRKKPRKVVHTPPTQKTYRYADGCRISDAVWQRAKQGTGKFNDVC